MGLPIRQQSLHGTQQNAVSHSFIRTVQHLIERCITFYLDRDDCVKALAKHAGIEPVITITVWKELEKANKEFFEDYLSKRIARRSGHVSGNTTNNLHNQHIGKKRTR